MTFNDLKRALFLTGGIVLIGLFILGFVLTIISIIDLTTLKEIGTERVKCIDEVGADYDGVGDCEMGYPEEAVKEAVKKLKDKFPDRDHPEIPMKTCSPDHILSFNKAFLDEINSIFGEDLIK